MAKKKKTELYPGKTFEKVATTKAGRKWRMTYELVEDKPAESERKPAKAEKSSKSRKAPVQQSLF